MHLEVVVSLVDDLHRAREFYLLRVDVLLMDLHAQHVHALNAAHRLLLL